MSKSLIQTKEPTKIVRVHRISCSKKSSGLKVPKLDEEDKLCIRKPDLDDKELILNLHEEEDIVSSDLTLRLNLEEGEEESNIEVDVGEPI